MRYWEAMLAYNSSEMSVGEQGSCWKEITVDDARSKGVRI